MARLGMDWQTLASARQNLIQAGLVAYEEPLPGADLSPCIENHPKSRTRMDAPIAIGNCSNRF